MENRSAPNTTATASNGSKYDLWITEDNVLTINIDKHSLNFPPVIEQCGKLNEMIQGLARATKAVLFHSENSEANADFSIQPIEDIANAIILLSKLSEAIRSESLPEVTA